MSSQALIIIRGNSGSGKSTVAERLREELDCKVAVVGQDALRRGILMETDSPEKTDIIGLLEQTVRYCLDRDYTVILEGILSKPKYKELLTKLIEEANCPTHVFYLDVSLEESIRRHATKPIADTVPTEKLEQWYQPQNYLDVPNEIIIEESSALQETVEKITSEL